MLFVAGCVYDTPYTHPAISKTPIIIWITKKTKTKSTPSDCIQSVDRGRKELQT
jgi:hypothetical protein